MRISTRQMHDLSVNSILDRQADLSHTNLQLSTGKRVMRPSDDPVAATQILSLKKAIDITQRYQDNISSVKSRLSSQEGVLTSVTNAIHGIRVKAVQGNNSHLDDPDRRAIAVEVKQRLEELLGLANTKASNGEYMFAGFRAEIAPISYDLNNGYQYRGDQGQRDIQIGPTYFTESTDNADAIFMRVRNGNGDFVTDYNLANVGTASIDKGVVYDKALLTRNDYSIDFFPPTPPSIGPVEYVITNVTMGTTTPLIIPPAGPGLPYIEGEPIQFDGIEVTVTGEPQAGDSFDITPSRSQDVFTTVHELIETLETAVTSGTIGAKFHMDMGSALQELDNAMGNILNTRSSIGARLNAVESQETVNSGYVLSLEETRSKLEDLDYAEATSRMNRELVGLQAAQQVYMKVQGLSLFNYMN